jgi:hypothetical protein
VRHLEDDIQSASVKWFSYQFPQLQKLLVAIPNGGKRNVREAARLKKAGVVAGTADLLLLVPNKHYHMLCCEVKTPSGKQSPYQKSWQSIAEHFGNKYVIVRSFDEFKNEIENYLSQ